VRPSSPSRCRPRIEESDRGAACCARTASGHAAAALPSVNGAGVARGGARAAARIHFTGRIEHDDLSDLLPVCKALVMPSTFPEPAWCLRPASVVRTRASYHPFREALLTPSLPPTPAAPRLARRVLALEPIRRATGAVGEIVRIRPLAKSFRLIASSYSASRASCFCSSFRHDERCILSRSD